MTSRNYTVNHGDGSTSSIVVNREQLAGITTAEANPVGTPFVRLGTLSSFTATSDSFDSGTNASGSNVRVGVVFSKALTLADTAKATLTITGVVDSINSSNGIGISPTQGVTGGGSWTPDDVPPALTTTGAFTRTFSLFDSNPEQEYLQGVNFMIEDGEQIAISSLRVTVESPRYKNYQVDRRATPENSRKGESKPLLSQVTGEAGCALSLRDLKHKDGSSVVARVRRSQDTTSYGETNFQAKNIKHLEDWVANKWSTVLPADVDPTNCKGVYGLRQMKRDYNDKAIRVRRSTDEKEVDVYVNSREGINDNSRTESGLSYKRFLNETVNIPMGNRFISQVNGQGVNIGQGIVTRATNNSFNCEVSKSGTADFDIRAGGQNYANIRKGTVKVSCSVTRNTLEENIEVQLWQLVDGQQYKTVGVIPEGKTGNFEFTYENTNATTGAIFRFTCDDENLDDGQLFDVKNIKIEGTAHTATLSVWHDQTTRGNHFRQTDQSMQATVAEYGALKLDEGGHPTIADFGNGKWMIADNHVYATTDTEYMMFAKIGKRAQTSGAYYLVSDNVTGLSHGGGGTRGILVKNDRLTNYHGFSYEGDVNFGGGFNDWARDGVFSQGTDGLVDGSTTQHSYDAYSNGANLHMQNASKATSRHLVARVIFNEQVSGANNNVFQGDCSEFIFYAGDQHANKWLIESSTNNYYGLYDDEYEWSGAVTSHFAGTANGITLVSGTETDIGFKKDLKYTINDSVTSNRFIRIVLNPNNKVYNTETALDVIRVSFYIDPDETTSTFTGTVAFRNGLNGGVLTNSGSFNATSGLVSFSFTRNSTSAILNNLVIVTTNSAGGGTLSLKNFKISRHKREARVHTWFDQSDKDKHLYQADQGRQPYLVQNGGYDPRGLVFKGNQLLRMASSTGALTGTPTSAPLGDYYTALFTVSRANDTVTRNTFAGTTIDFCMDANELPKLRRSSSVLMTANALTTTKGKQVMYIFMMKEDRFMEIHLNDSSQASPSIKPLTSNEGFDIIGDNHHTTVSATYAFVGTMNEAILFTKDQTINLPALKENINNQYELYS